MKRMCPNLILPSNSCVMLDVECSFEWFTIKRLLPTHYSLITGTTGLIGVEKVSGDTFENHCCNIKSFSSNIKKNLEFSYGREMSVFRIQKKR